MFFLIDYDGGAREIVKLREFDDAEKLRARYERLQIELNLTKRGLLLREVVLLEATDLLALKQAHPRYFQSSAEIAEDRIAFASHLFNRARYLKPSAVRENRR